MAHVQILEQPAKEIRFRYKSERRQKSDDDDDEANRATTSGIPGIHSDPPDKKTYPSIVIKGYVGWATIRVSCVGHAHENGKYRPHPHQLAGPNCKDGFYEEWLKVTCDDFVKVFDKLSIRCMRKRDVMESLELRRKNCVDPFKTGNLYQNINLGAVRLCFEVFIHGAGTLEALEPQVSKVILDKKKQNKLKISYCSHTSAPVTGAGLKIVLLCDKILEKEIEVVFFETGKGGKTEWETSARSEFIFKHMAVVVKVPPYRDPQSRLDHDVSISLRDLSEEKKSTLSYPFRYTGVQTDPAHKPQEDAEVVTYNTRYGPMLTRKRAKRMYWIPPELFNVPTSYNFQGATTGIPSTSTASELSNHHQPIRENLAMVDRFYSVPGVNQENRFFNRESSCPEQYVTGSSAAIPLSSRFDVPINNAVIDEKPNPDVAGFIQTAPYFRNNTGSEAIHPTTSSLETSNLKYETNEDMDVCNVTLTSNIEEQIYVPATCSLPSIFSNSNTDLPNSSNDAFCGLPPMNDLMSHLKKVQSVEENTPEDPYADFLNSPNYPNFEDIV